ncbi:bifunctional DNA-binding transcriptional regulator/O6-methylguanine-DNA methyltransferase Ada [Nitrosospira sp. Is2]|uniref:bifunctional DNA-binding transcriptional regulator/O6-methylguanine-DNA methyltransferase Ada n=1 Tax=Nitrosospira sp. Is2 TaxID=3080532 RepID=UPI002953B4EE|nr:bifunctional DNA-binding transcriptional regulator/O6-methylguanine-DNA methyltransferase Ada [Nitrosospira sp. Is2]WON73442.1 bifunctional DNA-binding transcriptional regulator/O6-methylguanine-DNA methyltransferase Ada [Nitrosospira sp. Is2]
MNMLAKKAQLRAVTVSDPRWADVVARNAEADGKFYFGVKTTGVYCRPACAARSAQPENVVFYVTPEEAERAGFRPCKRCQPDRAPLVEQYADKVTYACRVIEECEAIPSLEELAKKVGMSGYHFHRAFKHLTGLTPRQYAAAQREKRMRNQLRRGGSVTDAIFDAGYSSSGRFYEQSDKVLGMVPSHYRAGGVDTEIRFAIGECSLGSILVAQSDRGICALLLGSDPGKLARDLQDSFPRATLIGGDADFEELVATVIGSIEAPGIGLNLPLDVRGTAFQQRVWHALREIPPGQTESYADVANRIGAPGSVRAVGQACAANKLAVAIPCHRVVRIDGALAGYRWGVERKQVLLEKESGSRPEGEVRSRE